MRKFISCFLACLIFFWVPAAHANFSLHLRNAEVKAALQALASLSGENILTDDAVQGKVSVDLENTDFPTALDTLTSAKGLGYKKINQVIIVSTNEHLAQTGPLKVIPLNYASAPELVTTLKEIFPNKIWADKVTNALLFSGSDLEEKHLRTALTSLDQATRQITLEAKIIALSQEDSKSLGVNWSWDTLPQKRENTNDDDEADTYGGNFKFWHGYAFRFNATLNALIANGKAKILARPSILTIPGKEASIFIGDHIPVQTEKHDSSGAYTTTEYVDAGIKLKFTPIVSADGQLVTAKVHTEVATATLVSELTNYKITSRTADTHARLRSGETLVIGGLINEEEQHNFQKIPILGDIPLLGNLFKSKTTKKDKVEVIMLLTPYVTAAGDSPAIYKNAEQAYSQEFSQDNTPATPKQLKTKQKLNTPA